MYRKLTNKCLLINNNTINVLDSSDSKTFGMLVEEATLILNDNFCTISGMLVDYDCVQSRKSLDDLETVPDEKYIKEGYLSLIDLIKKKKRKYVSAGWFRIKERSPITIKMTNWKLIE